MKIKSRNSGISLITLILTIIVIIILAAIVIFSGMRTPEQAQLSKVISDIDSVQTAIDQIYYDLYTEKAVKGEVWTKSQLYEAVATGEKNRDNLNGTGLIEIAEDSLISINLPVYEGRKWYVAVSDSGENIKIGSAVLFPGLDLEGKVYSTLLDVLNGGVKTFKDSSTGVLLRNIAVADIKNLNWNDSSKIKMVLQADNESVQVPIPVGFDYYLGTGETGLVIKDSKGNEFVWIPVEKANGTIYEESETPKILYGTVETYKYAVREPELVGYDSVMVDDIEDFSQELVNEFNAMAESVKKYGGFYVGRYELGIDENNNIVCKPNVTELDAGNSKSRCWYGLYKACQVFSSGSMHSSMIWGSQWDAMVNFIGNHTALNSGIRKLTGEYEDEYNHVHDTSTGLSEWIMKKAATNSRSFMGGCYKWSASSNKEGGVGTNDMSSTIGTRVQLYIK